MEGLTNDNVAICTPEDATEACAFRWKIEQYHREVKCSSQDLI